MRIFFRISTGQRLTNRPVHGISYSTVSGRECTKRVCEPRAARVAHCRPFHRSARPLRTEHSSSAQPADGWHSWMTDGDHADNNNSNDLQVIYYCCYILFNLTAVAAVLHNNNNNNMTGITHNAT